MGIVHVLQQGIVVSILDCRSRRTIPPNTYRIQIAVIFFLIVRGEYALVPNPPTRTSAQLVIAELLHGFSNSPLPVHVAVGARRKIDSDFPSAPFSNSLPHDIPGLWGGGGVRDTVIGDEPIGRGRVQERCVVHPTVPIFSLSGMRNCRTDADGGGRR